MNSTRTQRSLSALALMLLALLSVSCVSLDYDLATVPVPVSAKPAEVGGEVEPFRIEATNVLWVHGLFGHTPPPPDVAELVAEKAQGWDRIAGFRVRQEGRFHQWLATHLSLTLVRMRTVVIEGQLVRDTAR